MVESPLGLVEVRLVELRKTTLLSNIISGDLQRRLS